MNLIFINGTITNLIDLHSYKEIPFADFEVTTRSSINSEPQHIRCKAMGKMAEKIVRACKKGTLVFICGEIRSKETVKGTTKSFYNYVFVTEIEIYNSLIKGNVELDDFLEIYSPNGIKQRTSSWKKK